MGDLFQFSIQYKLSYSTVKLVKTLCKGQV